MPGAGVGRNQAAKRASQRISYPPPITNHPVYQAQDTGWFAKVWDLFPGQDTLTNGGIAGEGSQGGNSFEFLDTFVDNVSDFTDDLFGDGPAPATQAQTGAPGVFGLSSPLIMPALLGIGLWGLYLAYKR